MTAKRGRQQAKKAVASPGHLTVAEVVDIINACRSANVSSFGYAGLSLTFEKTLDEFSEAGSDPVPPEAADPLPTRRQTRPATTPSREELAAARQRLAEIKVAQDEANAVAKIEARDLELERLKVEDPLAYEEAIENGEVIL